MKELIKVTANEEGQQLVSGRELYEVLGINSNFSTWIKRMIEYGFIENVITQLYGTIPKMESSTSKEVHKA